MNKKRRSVSFDSDVLSGIEIAMKKERRKFTEQVNFLLYKQLTEMGYVQESPKKETV